MKENNLVPFTKEGVRDYLDGCIRFWRGRRDKKNKDEESEHAIFYVDAFQSARTSIFGEIL